MSKKWLTAPKDLKTRPDEFDRLLCKANGHDWKGGICHRCGELEPKP